MATTTPVTKRNTIQNQYKDHALEILAYTRTDENFVVEGIKQNLPYNYGEDLYAKRIARKKNRTRVSDEGRT